MESATKQSKSAAGVPAEWRMALPDEDATAALAEKIATLAGAGAVVTLSGDLGAGKTTFARAFIRHLTGNPGLEVPSPTFTLMQLYDGPDFAIVHADLYRIGGASELVELGWEEVTESALTLVEWAERAPDFMPPDRLDVAFFTDANRDPHWRRVILTGYGSFAGKLVLERGIDRLLSGAGWAGASRSFMLGDASTRAYERLQAPDGSKAILMISPRRPDGPPVRFGKPYSAIARLAEDVRPFVAMSAALGEQGFSAPQVYACDEEAGLAIIEDLGSDGIVRDGAPDPDRYMKAAELLAVMHTRHLPDTITYGDGGSYRIPPYDMDALLIEIELLNDWYAPYLGLALSSGAKATFVNIWRRVLQEIIGSRPTWTLRDYHSPNVIWLDGRDGIRKVGIIDFQDCVMGLPAYDVASLLQDARVTVPDQLEIKLLSHYARIRREADSSFDVTAFARHYAIMCAQRGTKVLGIFARLSRRDGKHQYLDHLPRIEGYMTKALAHPQLEEVRAWYAQYMPHVAGEGGAR
ncbi:MAG: tRNA (adenosine(37)-N6)-threonylcarbamoyltransferase complex ATPase subunit type 1 TsaE [Hyphomicrobiales bacterium]|nr:tRNA (adenosine(37)-N6)-threonylcarbamoyltransferase complex ATPase subunit type 1 TsaE [Hyphomicrobiales bacterium]